MFRPAKVRFFFLLCKFFPFFLFNTAVQNHKRPVCYHKVAVQDSERPLQNAGTCQVAHIADIAQFFLRARILCKQFAGHLQNKCKSEGFAGRGKARIFAPVYRQNAVGLSTC